MLSRFLEWIDSLIFGYYDENKLVQTYVLIVFSMLTIPWRRQYHLQETSKEQLFSWNFEGNYVLLNIRVLHWWLQK